MPSISCHIRSAGSGPEVVLLHASGSSGRQWDALVGALQGRYRLHAVDLHGHGATAPWTGAGRMTLEDDLALLQPLLARGRVHLVGHSYGGALALKIAALHPERVASVAVHEPVLFRLLLDYRPRDAAIIDVLSAARSLRNWYALGHSDRAAHRFIDFWSGDGAWERLGDTPRQAIAGRMGSVIRHFDALFHDPLTRAGLSRLSVPVLCTTGARTRPAPRRIAELLRLALPNGVHETIPGAGHLGPITHARAFAWRIGAHLDSHVAANEPESMRQAA